MNKEHHDQFDQDLKRFQKEWFIRDPAGLTKIFMSNLEDFYAIIQGPIQDLY